MSSSRFPGKVLAPFRGDPIVLHVVRAVEQALGADALVVATSTQPSDDPLGAYLESLGVPVFRGSLDDVLGRFQACLDAYPCDWVLRICADSPLLDPAVIRLALDAVGDEMDVVTTTSPRTFAKGQNVELVREAVLLGLDGPELTAEDREHVTRFLYRHPERFRILTLESGDPALAGHSVVVDTVDDLKRLEAEV
jgi:spore coat polysaccharide biosynthesis protein SpsF